VILGDSQGLFGKGKLTVAQQLSISLKVFHKLGTAGHPVGPAERLAFTASRNAAVLDRWNSDGYHTAVR
jgi:hypothetical protein